MYVENKLKIISIKLAGVSEFLSFILMNTLILPEKRSNRIEKNIAFQSTTRRHIGICHDIFSTDV